MGIPTRPKRSGYPARDKMNVLDYYKQIVLLKKEILNALVTFERSTSISSLNKKLRTFFVHTNYNNLNIISVRVRIKDVNSLEIIFKTDRNQNINILYNKKDLLRG